MLNGPTFDVSDDFATMALMVQKSSHFANPIPEKEGSRHS